LNYVLADQHLVAVDERGFAHAFVVDVSSIERTQVFYDVVAIIPINPGVVSGDGKVVDLHGVVRKPADRGGRLRQRNLLQDGLANFQLEFGYCCPPETSLLKMAWYHGCSGILSSRLVMLSAPPRWFAA